MKYRYEAIVKIGSHETIIECYNIRQLMKELQISGEVIEKLIHKKGNCFAKKWLTINRFDNPTGIKKSKE
jgi:hypothetical protein